MNFEVQLAAELVLELSVDIGEVLDIGATPRGHLRVIPITGGSFTGKNIRGLVVPGGADWNTRMGNGISHVFAKYTLRTEDGAYIGVQNEGYLDERLPEAHIQTTPQFQASESGKYAWLSQGVYAGTLRGREGGRPGVIIQVFRLA